MNPSPSDRNFTRDQLERARVEAVSASLKADPSTIFGVVGGGVRLAWLELIAEEEAAELLAAEQSNQCNDRLAYREARGEDV